MIIVPMTAEHAPKVYEMMQTFYASDAVLTNGSDAIFRSDIQACIGDNPYLEGFVFRQNALVVGYAMIAKSFSTEFGRPCIWIEDIYLQPQVRGQGMAGTFFRYLEEAYPDAILRLEAEEENHHAIRAYRKAGFDVMPYLEMFKLL
jgi:ribosomal protein S18 acetylase RimI-like enzyme